MTRGFRLTSRVTIRGMGFLALAAIQAQQPTQVLPNSKLLNSELIDRGKRVYMNHCSGCHGEKGDGKGPGAYGLNPKPRDMTTGVFKFRTTPSSALPTDEDLVRTVKQGVLGTSMPAFGLMADRDALAVAQYIKVFSDIWNNPSAYAPPVFIPNPPDWFKNPKERADRAAKGKELFASACVSCHGEDGSGRGLSAALMVDSWGYPIKPHDLRQPYIRGGRNLTDIYKAIVTGINGSPMPSFAEAVTEDQRWEIVAFIDQLRREKRAKSGRPVQDPVIKAPPAQTATPKPVPAKQEAPSIYE